MAVAISIHLHPYLLSLLVRHPYLCVSVSVEDAVEETVGAAATVGAAVDLRLANVEGLKSVFG